MSMYGLRKECGNEYGAQIICKVLCESEANLICASTFHVHLKEDEYVHMMHQVIYAVRKDVVITESCVNYPLNLIIITIHLYLSFQIHYLL